MCDAQNFFPANRGEGLLRIFWKCHFAQIIMHGSTECQRRESEANIRHLTPMDMLMIIILTLAEVLKNSYLFT